MDKERLESFLQLHGYGPEKAHETMTSLLQKLQAKGLSEKDAVTHITRDLEKKGSIYQVIIANKPAKPEVPEKPKKPEFQCPKCGHPQKRGNECVKCGVLFTKLAPKKHPKQPPKKKVLEGESPIAASLRRLEEKQAAAPSPGFSAWVSRNKSLTLIFFLLFFVIVAGLLLEQYYLRKFHDVLADYKIDLSLDSREDIQASLTDLRNVIETAASLVGKWGMPEDDVREYAGKTIAAVQDFSDRMREVAGDAGTLHGHNVEQTRKMLCGGIAMMMNNIRKEAVANQMQVGLSLRGWDGCNPGDYRLSL